MKNQSGFAHLVIVGLIVVLSVTGVGALVYSRSNDTSKSLATDSQTNSKSVTSTSAATIDEKAYELPAGWKKFTSTEGFTSFAYPSEFGEMMSPAKGEAGKYTDGGFVSSSLETSSVEGVAGRFTYTRYTDTSPVINSRKYGPTIQLTGSEWKVVTANEYDPSDLKAGDTYKDFTQRDSLSGIKVYNFGSGDEGIRVDTLVWTDNGRMFTLRLPSVDLGIYGGNGTAANEKKRTVGYENLVSRVLDSIGQ